MSILWTRPCGLIFLLDYDNFNLRRYAPRQVLAGWLSELQRPPDLSSRYIDILVRLYGGWFEGFSFTQKRLEAVANLSSEWPSLISAGASHARLFYEFADGLITPGGGAVSHTLVARSSTIRIRRKPYATSCQNPACELHKARKWLLSSTGCTASDCSMTFNQCHRPLEQKQVDVHIALDLCHLAARAAPQTEIALVSDDKDLIPALLQSGLMLSQSNSVSWIRESGTTSHADRSLGDLRISVLAIAERGGRDD